MGTNARIQGDIQLWKAQKELELQKENSKDEQRAWKDRAPNDQLLIHDITAAQL